jgi:RimJ/RimL family protein N-acetyltransferase
MIIAAQRILAAIRGRVKFPIETERLRIVPFEWDDAKEAHRLFRDRRLWNYNDAPRPRTRRGSRNRLALYIATQEEHGLSAWAVREKATGELIGDCGLIPADWHRPEFELVFRFTPRRWGEGFATEATRAVLAAGLDEGGLDTVQSRIHTDNEAAIRVVERIGMTCEETVVLDGTTWAIYAICS